MPTVVTNYFKLQEGGQNVSISGDTWICSLMDQHVNSASEDTLKDYEKWSDVGGVSAYEASGTGYTSGAALSGIGWYTDATDTVNKQRMSATDLTFSSVTISSYGACIWKETDGLIMGFIDFGQEYVSSNAPFVINWNSGGIFNKI